MVTTYHKLIDPGLKNGFRPFSWQHNTEPQHCSHCCCSTYFFCRIGIAACLAAVVISAAIDGLERGIHQWNTQNDIAVCGLLTITSIIHTCVSHRPFDCGEIYFCFFHQ